MNRRTRLRIPTAAGSGAALIPLIAALAAGPLAAQSPVETKAFESSQFRYAVALPAACRHEEGPGTIEAICATDLDLKKSEAASAATALVLQAAAETKPADGDATAAQQRYSEGAFREELPEAVCGESDKARVKIENVKQAVENGHLIYTADVACSAVRFLQIGERRAAVRHVIAPDMLYRLVARAPMEDFEKQRPTIDAFFASFRIAPPEK